ncbi:MAG TPA: DUF1844 domain-containing protein [Blastocatellia bacterium]|nr:DUF1844 domain-containing protein [Blastocatellia bacterium]
MAEREDTGYKVTDRRKYNPDGSPREAVEPEVEPVVTEAEPQTPIRESTANNVVSFPGEAAKKQPEPLPQAEPIASETRTTVPAPTAAQAAAGQAEQAYNQARGPQSSRLPEASFLSLANMLAVEAAMHMGLIQSPGEEAPPLDLEAARHLIDMLGMLQTKTRGNLTGEEDNLLENILADLRMQFVAISKRR